MTYEHQQHCFRVRQRGAQSVVLSHYDDVCTRVSLLSRRAPDNPIFLDESFDQGKTWQPCKGLVLTFYGG